MALQNMYCLISKQTVRCDLTAYYERNRWQLLWNSSKHRKKHFKMPVF